VAIVFDPRAKANATFPAAKNALMSLVKRRQAVPDVAIANAIIPGIPKFIVVLLSGHEKCISPAIRDCRIARGP
jgi:hypothetical protein